MTLDDKLARVFADDLRELMMISYIVLSVTCKAPLGVFFALRNRPEALRKQEGAKSLVIKRIMSLRVTHA